MSTKQIQRQKLRDEAEAGMEWVGSDIYGLGIASFIPSGFPHTKQNKDFLSVPALFFRVEFAEVP